MVDYDTATMYPDRHGLAEGYDAAKHRRYLLNTHIPKYMQFLEDELNENEDDTWLGSMDAISMADIAWYSTLKWLKSGKFDGFTADQLHRYPNVYRFIDEVESQLEWDDELEEESTEEKTGQGEKKEQ